MSFDTKTLLAAGLHFGHKTVRWNPKMKPYLLGSKQGVHLFDLEKTAAGLEKALAFLEKSAADGKTIMLVSTKQQTLDIIPAIAEKLGLPYVTEKWYGGLLTNWTTTKGRLRTLRDLKAERERDGFARYVKAERNKMNKEIERMEVWYAGIEDLERRPDVVFVLDAMRDKLAITEARISGCTVVAMADSNVDPDQIDYPIPGNDDAVRAIDFILNQVAAAIERGQKNPTQKKTVGEKKAEQREKSATEKPVKKAAEKIETAAQPA